MTTWSSFRSSVGDELGHRGLAEVAAADQPLVALLGSKQAGQPEQGGAVGEDADHVGAPVDLAVDPLRQLGGWPGPASGNGGASAVFLSLVLGDFPVWTT